MAAFRIRLARDGQVGRLFQHVAAAHGAVHDEVRERHPGLARCKLHIGLGTFLLVLHVLLERVMEMKHQVVVFGAARLGDTQRGNSRADSGE